MGDGKRQRLEGSAGSSSRIRYESIEPADPGFAGLPIPDSVTSPADYLESSTFSNFMTVFCFMGISMASPLPGFFIFMVMVV